MSVMFRKASLKDISGMQELVASEVQTGIILYRSDDELATNIRSYMLAFAPKGELVGYGALHVHSPTLAEVRSLVVDAAFRGRHIGAALVERLVEEARTLGLEQVLTLTYVGTFFEKLGFREVPKETIPDHKIWADCIKCKHFPVCNEIAMIKTLP